MPPSCRPFALMPPPPLNPAFCFSVTFTMASMIGEPSTACGLCENCTLTFSSPLVLVRSVMSSDMRPESVAPGLMFLRWRNMYAGLVCPSHGSLVLRSMKRTSTLPILGSCTCSSMMPSAEMPTLTNSCDFLVVVPPLHLVHGGDHGVGVEHLANLRLYHALYYGDGQLGRPAKHHGPNHGVCDELELEGHPVAGVHGLRGHRLEQPGAEDPLDVGADVGDGVGEVRADGDDGSRELREVRVLGVEFHGGDEDGPGSSPAEAGLPSLEDPASAIWAIGRATNAIPAPMSPIGLTDPGADAGPDPMPVAAVRLATAGPRNRRRALPDPRELRAEGLIHP